MIWFEIATDVALFGLTAKMNIVYAFKPFVTQNNKCLSNGQSEASQGFIKSHL